MIAGWVWFSSRSASAEPECIPTLLRLITASPKGEISNLQENIFYLRAHGQVAEAQAIEDKVISILKGPFSRNSIPLGAGSAGGRYYFFESGIVGVGKKAGWHWSANVEAEVAAFKIDRLYDLNLVPVTIARNDANAHLSMQLFYKGAKDARLYGIQNVSKSDLKKMQIFDYLIQNFDRKESNYLVTEEGRLVAIDHGVSMHNARSNRYSPKAPELKDLDMDFFKTADGSKFLAKLKQVPDQEIESALHKLCDESTLQKLIARKNLLLRAASSID
jgi:hypothetical protein